MHARIASYAVLATYLESVTRSVVIGVSKHRIDGQKQSRLNLHERDYFHHPIPRSTVRTARNALNDGFSLRVPVGYRCFTW
jgi:hypothetical protein